MQIGAKKVPALKCTNVQLGALPRCFSLFFFLPLLLSVLLQGQKRILPGMAEKTFLGGTEFLASFSCDSVPQKLFPPFLKKKSVLKINPGHASEGGLLANISPLTPPSKKWNLHLKKKFWTRLWS